MASNISGVEKLRERTRGKLLAPGRAEYESSRRAFNALAGGRPVAILQPVHTEDIIAAVRWAEDADIGIGIRGGGHSVAGHSSPEGGLLVDLSAWRGAEVDPGTRTAVALGGSRLMDLDVATSAYGLAAPSGTFFDTGIGGLTLGGGISYIVASEGFACDTLIGAELVDGAGEVIEVDEEREPELLWGLRGGGGNFGIVTRLRYRLTDVTRVAGGRIDFSGEGVQRVLENVISLEQSAPDGLTMQAIVRRWPADRALGLTLLVSWRGEAAAAAELLGRLVSDPSRIAGDLRQLSWLQLQALNAPLPFGLRHYWKGHLVSETPGALVDAVLQAAREISGTSVILIELIHGVAHRIPASTAAFGGRGAAANVTALAIWGDRGQDEAQMSWARTTAARLEPFSVRGSGYLNYPELDQSAGRVANAFPPETFERLRQLKALHDPANRFRFNANILPAGS